MGISEFLLTCAKEKHYAVDFFLTKVSFIKSKLDQANSQKNDIPSQVKLAVIGDFSDMMHPGRQLVLATEKPV